MPTTGGCHCPCEERGNKRQVLNRGKAIIGEGDGECVVHGKLVNTTLNDGEKLPNGEFWGMGVLQITESTSTCQDGGSERSAPHRGEEFTSTGNQGTDVVEGDR